MTARGARARVSCSRRSTSPARWAHEWERLRGSTRAEISSPSVSRERMDGLSPAVSRARRARHDGPLARIHWTGDQLACVGTDPSAVFGTTVELLPSLATATGAAVLGAIFAGAETAIVSLTPVRIAALLEHVDEQTRRALVRIQDEETAVRS